MSLGAVRSLLPLQQPRFQVRKINPSNYKETLLETITTWPLRVQLSRVGAAGALEKVLDNVVEDGIGWSARRAQVSGTQALVLHPGKCPGILRPHAP